jgi:hypothetical protein
MHLIDSCGPTFSNRLRLTEKKCGFLLAAWRVQKLSDEIEFSYYNVDLEVWHL